MRCVASAPFLPLMANVEKRNYCIEKNIYQQQKIKKNQNVMKKINLLPAYNSVDWI
jgi:hypothetical protein